MCKIWTNWLPPKGPAAENDTYKCKTKWYEGQGHKSILQQMAVGILINSVFIWSHLDNQFQGWLFDI